MSQESTQDLTVGNVTFGSTDKTIHLDPRIPEAKKITEVFADEIDLSNVPRRITPVQEYTIDPIHVPNGETLLAMEDARLGDVNRAFDIDSLFVEDPEEEEETFELIHTEKVGDFWISSLWFSDVEEFEGMQIIITATPIVGREDFDPTIAEDTDVIAYFRPTLERLRMAKAFCRIW